MSKAHEVFLQDVLRISGVKSAALVNYRGEFLLSAGMFTPNTQSASQLGTYLVQMVATTEAVRGPSEEITVLYSEGRLSAFFNLDLLIDTPYGAQEVFVAIISNANVNLPTLRMTMKVAWSKLKSDKAVRDLRLNNRTYPQNMLTRERMDDLAWQLVATINQAGQ
jgi:hypothetical protein